MAEEYKAVSFSFDDKSISLLEELAWRARANKSEYLRLIIAAEAEKAGIKFMSKNVEPTE